jgi:hypothetical protein
LGPSSSSLLSLEESELLLSLLSSLDDDDDDDELLQKVKSFISIPEEIVTLWVPISLILEDKKQSLLMIQNRKRIFPKETEAPTPAQRK